MRYRREAGVNGRTEGRRSVATAWLSCRERITRAQVALHCAVLLQRHLCIGAIRAIRESGLRVPEDVSVVGFDDIREAAYQYPGITTVRQPLREMGELAGHTIVDRIE